MRNVVVVFFLLLLLLFLFQDRYKSLDSHDVKRLIDTRWIPFGARGMRDVLVFSNRIWIFGPEDTVASFCIRCEFESKIGLSP